MNTIMPWSQTLIHARRTVTGRLVLRQMFRRLPFLFAPLAALFLGSVLILPSDTFRMSPAWGAMRAAGVHLFGATQAQHGWGVVIAGLAAIHLLSATFAATRFVPLLTLWLLAILFGGVSASFAMSVGFVTTGTTQLALNSLMAAWAYVYWES